MFQNEISNQNITISTLDASELQKNQLEKHSKNCQGYLEDFADRTNFSKDRKLIKGSTVISVKEYSGRTGRIY